MLNDEGDVLLRHEMSLKVIYEKVTFLNCDFCKIFWAMTGYTYKLFKNIPRAKGT